MQNHLGSTKRLTTLSLSAYLACCLGSVVSAPHALAAPCDYTSVPQEGPVLQRTGSSGSSQWGGPSHGSSSTNQGRHPGQIPIIRGHTQAVHLLTGPGSPERTDTKFGIAGTDLGIAWTGPENSTYLAFGDTMSCVGPIEQGWRSNVLLRTADRDYSDSLTVDEALTTGGWASQGFAQEFIHSLKVPGIEHTVIPTAGIYVDGTHYLDYMSVRNWGDPGFWTTNYAATVKSTDGQNWELVPESIRINSAAEDLFALPAFPAYRLGNQNLQMSALVEKDGYIYRFSTKAGRDGSAVLARAPRAEFPNEAAFRYFNSNAPGGSQWDPNPAQATPVITGQVSELSVAWHEGLGAWVALYLDPHGMVVRTAPELTGPWSAKRTLVSMDTIPGIYGGFILPNQQSTGLDWVATTWRAYNVMVMHTDLTQVPGLDSASPVPTNLDPAQDNLVVEKVVDFTPGAVAAVTDATSAVAPAGVSIEPADPVDPTRVSDQVLTR